MTNNTYLISLEAQRLEHFIFDCLDRAIKLNQKAAIVPEVTTNDPETFIDTKRVSELLDVSSVTIWDWEKKGLLQSYRMGNLKRFKLNEVMAAPTRIKRKGVNDGI